MDKLKKLNRIVLFLILFLLFFNINISHASTIKLHNNREPRINPLRTDKKYLYITLHDDYGINLDKTTITFDGNKIKLELIEVKNGVYTSKGKRIRDLEKSESYSGKKYDYGVKIKRSSLSTDKYKNISVLSYDYLKTCYVKETFKVKNYEKPNHLGFYYNVNRAPRQTFKDVDGKLNVYAIDYSGIKNIKIVSKKSNEVVYTFDASKYKSKGKDEKGITKDGIFYPTKVVENIDTKLLKNAQRENKDGTYDFKVITEDISGIKSEKTMSTRVETISSTKTKTTDNTTSKSNANSNANNKSKTKADNDEAKAKAKTNNTSKANTNTQKK